MTGRSRGGRRDVTGGLREGYIEDGEAMLEDSARKKKWCFYSVFYSVRIKKNMYDRRYSTSNTNHYACAVADLIPVWLLYYLGLGYALLYFYTRGSNLC